MEGCQKCDPGGIIEPHPRVISTRSLLMKIGKIDVHHAGEEGWARGGGEIHRMQRENKLLILNLNSILSLRRGEGEASVFHHHGPCQGTL